MVPVDWMRFTKTRGTTDHATEGRPGSGGIGVRTDTRLRAEPGSAYRRNALRHDSSCDAFRQQITKHTQPNSARIEL